jgi:hypothetical protein
LHVWAPLFPLKAKLPFKYNWGVSDYYFTCMEKFLEDPSKNHYIWKKIFIPEIQRSDSRRLPRVGTNTKRNQNILIADRHSSFRKFQVTKFRYERTLGNITLHLLTSSREGVNMYAEFTPKPHSFLNLCESFLTIVACRKTRRWHQ